jgi:hypothetical protein
MAYLRSKDFDLIVMADNLAQVISSDTSVRLFAERAAKEEIEFYLSSKFDLTKEFTDTATYNNSTTYKAKNRVYLDATAYSATSTYTVGTLVLQAGSVYRCLTAVTVAEAFTANKWTLIGAQHDLYYVTLPHDEFNYLGVYKVGDHVWWKDKVYTCLTSSITYAHDEIIQYNSYADVPIRNIFPDDALYGETYWGIGTTYSVAAGTLPTDTTKWTTGDNRSQLVLENMLHIALYKALPRIAPRNIPTHRKEMFTGAIEWLKEAKKGEGTPNIPLIQPAEGNRIRYGGNTKNINHY